MDARGWKEMEVVLVNFDNLDEIQEELDYVIDFDLINLKGQFGSSFFFNWRIFISDSINYETIFFKFLGDYVDFLGFELVVLNEGNQRVIINIVGLRFEI